MAKRQPTPPPPDWRRDNPQYEQRILDMEEKYGTKIYVGKYMVGLTNKYQASAESISKWASGDTANLALQNLAKKLEG